ncbi:MAG: hypothetical protein ETSY1_21520 [Candidatus Entotheonella factor]|uniref:Uncharacterized protein n=1 Tax=Entotheonella factor TaxID=1429438 RepID=W4LID5_ENTF1|nr:MAG: hypothetical protein ETSY1_21520 [Candidatus Entotheonella factor]
MADAQLFTTFYMGLGLAVVVVLIAATLLILVQRAAQRILELAVAALGLVQEIKGNTHPIWALQETNRTAAHVLDTAGAIRDHGATVATALHESDQQGGRSG